ncbi:MAG: hypothetical protein LBH25_06190 [Fibromonadaceae bacterium]|jgi:uncharacterized protein (TIGR02145 family)|nr:hypothetical protein [Fibromonadaceae bacterium]
MNTRITRKGVACYAPTVAAILALAMAFTLNACGGSSNENSTPPAVSSSVGSDGPSSSSVAPPSSSSGTATGNSSSSSAPAASVGFCDGFTDGTKRTHYGKEKEQFCDKRDGKKYVYIEIDGLVYMAENLNYEASTGNSACYDNAPSNCATYGRLYDWTTAMALPSKCNNIRSSDDEDCAIETPHKGICPDGWHIISDAEWNTLRSNSQNGQYGVDFGKNIKASEGWESYSSSSGMQSGNGEDVFGFTALPGGIFRNSSFERIKNSAFWWSITIWDDASHGGYNVVYSQGTSNSEYSKLDLLSVRCMKTNYIPLNY